MTQTLAGVTLKAGQVPSAAQFEALVAALEASYQALGTATTLMDAGKPVDRPFADQKAAAAMRKIQQVRDTCLR